MADATYVPTRPRRASRGLSAVPYLPGLDGMRAIAVVAVMLYHANHEWLPGGFLGVEVFFVISGYLITLLLMAEREQTGHIDLLQVRNGAIHILDYKPDARTNKPIAQLAIYALALTRPIPGLKLFDIKCAWFNEQEDSEFFPRTLFVHARQ